MKNFLTLVFLLASSFVFCQNDRFRFGLAVAPHFSDFFYSGNTDPWLKDIYKNSEKTQLGFSTSVFSRYQFNEKWVGQAGIGYTKSGFNDKIRRGFIFEMPEPGFPEALQFVFNFHELTMPLALIRNFSKKKHKFYAVGGLTPNFTFSRKKTLKSWFSDGSITVSKEDYQILDDRKLNLNALLGLGYNFRLGKKTNLLVQPTFETQLFGISKTAAEPSHFQIWPANGHYFVMPTEK